MTVCVQTKKDTGDSHPADNWGRFATRLYFRSRCRPEEGQSQDTIWLYVAISVVYFLLIGMVLLILLLAPKFRITSSNTSTSGGSIASGTILPPEPSLAAESGDYAVTESKESFQASPKDHLFDIDPRSPIFRGDRHHDRLRINSKFLQD